MKKIFAVLGTFCMTFGLFTFNATETEAADPGNYCQFTGASGYGWIIQPSIYWKTSAGTCYNEPSWISTTQDYVIRTHITSKSNTNESYMVYLEEWVNGAWVARAHTGTDASGRRLMSNSLDWGLLYFSYDYNHYSLKQYSWYRLRLSDPSAVDYKTVSFSQSGI